MANELLTFAEDAGPRDEPDVREIGAIVLGAFTGVEEGRRSPPGEVLP
jgi:hypothetical protein